MTSPNKGRALPRPHGFRLSEVTCVELHRRPLGRTFNTARLPAARTGLMWSVIKHSTNLPRLVEAGPNPWSAPARQLPTRATDELADRGTVTYHGHSPFWAVTSWLVLYDARTDRARRSVWKLSGPNRVSTDSLAEQGVSR